MPWKGLFSPKKKKLNKNKRSNDSTRMSAKRPLNQTSPDNQLSTVNKQLSKVAKTSRSRSPSIQTRLPAYWLGPPGSLAVPTQNSFAPLASDDAKNDEIIEATSEIKICPKPPPLYIHGVSNIKPLIIEIEQVSGKRYALKSLNGNKVMLQLSNKEDYCKVTDMLKGKKTEFHSYQMKDEKSFKVILKGVHQSSDTTEIIDALKELGHEACDISIVRSRKTGKDLPMFFVNLKKNTNNKDIYKITRLVNMVVSIEPPHTNKKEIPQCARCQRFGHTKSYCHLGPRCVKCTKPHLTSECPRKEKDNKVVCVNCEGDHPANYKGCLVYQNLRKKLHPIIKNKIDGKNNNIWDNSNIDPKVSFADKVKGSNDPTNSSSSQSNDMLELKQMMKGLMNQMSTMLNLLTAVVSKIT